MTRLAALLLVLACLAIPVALVARQYGTPGVCDGDLLVADRATLRAEALKQSLHRAIDAGEAILQQKQLLARVLADHFRVEHPERVYGLESDDEDAGRPTL